MASWPVVVVSRMGAVSSSDTRVVPRVPLVQGLPLPPPDGRVVVAGLVPAGVVAQRSGKQVGEDREDHRHLLPLRAPVHVEEARPPFDLVVVELVQRIAHDPRLHSLVDELYFEYHFYFDGKNFGWLTHKGGANYKRWGRHSVDDALRLMRRLRERGVRAHFWV